MSDAVLTPTAEEAVIGAMLIDPACVGDVLTQVRPSDFGSARLRALFEAAQALYLAQAPIDAVTMVERAGGGDLAQTAKQCMDLTPTAANVLHYCGIVRDQTAMRRLHEAAEALTAAKTLDEARDVIASAQSVLSDKPGMTVMSLAEMMADFMRRMGQPKPDYVKWGMGMLDQMLHTGRGSYVIIAARPSTGKTALGLQLGLNIARSKRVGFFSLETVPEVAGDRIAAQTLGVTLQEIKDRKIDPTGMTALASQMAQAELLRGTFDFISASSMTVADIRAAALAKRYDVVIIDYVQLIKPAGRGDRTELMQGVSMELRAMAQMTGIVVVALAQLRRPDTQQKTRAPTMADLKESGQFEQDADTILLMYLEDQSNRSSDRRIKIEKNKEGYAGFVSRFAFDGKKQRFSYVNADGSKPDPKKAKFTESEEIEQLELPFEE